MLHGQLRWTFPIQYLSRVAVQPVLDLGYPLFRHLGKIRPFGEESAYHAIVVLVGPFFPGSVAVAVVDLKARPAKDRLS